ncbi:MAG TPA: phosphoribosyl-AMP cyclohydrolase [Candidatus Peribacterales bacterium]|nr:phosphoribosyl-AMP cyclohydrolase [Candidatus Peribacterales bacterium]
MQERSTSEIIVVSRLEQEKFEELMEWWPNRSSTPEPEWSSHAIPEELFIDCDADCLLIKTSFDRDQRNRCMAFFRPLTAFVPQDLFKGSGLILAVTQDRVRKDVFMAAFMNEEALERTLSEGTVHYYSRKRQGLWEKGEESGNYQYLASVRGRYDAKAHAVILNIDQIGGAACHDGYRSCFYRKVEEDGSLKVISERVFNPSDVYKK